MITTSSTKAEVIAINYADKEEFWIKRLLNKLRPLTNNKKIKTVKMLADNKSSIIILSESENQQKIKHYKVQYF